MSGLSRQPLVTMKHLLGDKLARGSTAEKAADEIQNAGFVLLDKPNDIVFVLDQIEEQDVRDENTKKHILAQLEIFNYSPAAEAFRKHHSALLTRKLPGKGAPGGDKAPKQGPGRPQAGASGKEKEPKNESETEKETEKAKGNEDDPSLRCNNSFSDSSLPEEETNPADYLVEQLLDNLSALTGEPRGRYVDNTRRKQLRTFGKTAFTTAMSSLKQQMTTGKVRNAAASFSDILALDGGARLKGIE